MRVCVFGSASAKTSESFLVASKPLGAVLAHRDDLCIIGGGESGCMGALNRGCVENKGRVIGVIHAKWIGEEVSQLLQNWTFLAHHGVIRI
jgi:predicted Rossmann-fold nucleotide-binding protein